MEIKRFYLISVLLVGLVPAIHLSSFVSGLWFFRFKEMDPSISGRGAEPVFRDKTKGE